jgi:hypothetical protein
MEHNNTGENIHIYLKTDKEQDHVLKNTSSYEKYIILSNETLQHENKTLLTENSKLSNQIDQLQEDCEKSENSIRYMRGFLKNIVIMEQLSNKKTAEFKKINEDFNKAVSSYNYKTIKHLRYLQAILIIIIAIIYESNFFSTLQTFVLIFISIVFSAFHESTIKEMTLPNMETNLFFISNIDTELNELKKGQDFLHDYIDIM